MKLLFVPSHKMESQIRELLEDGFKLDCGPHAGPLSFGYYADFSETSSGRHWADSCHADTLDEAIDLAYRVAKGEISMPEVSSARFEKQGA